MPDHEEGQERRLHRAAITRATGQPPEPDREPDDEVDEDDSAARRMEHQHLWVDLQVRQAIARGEFDNLPGSGKPIRGLGEVHDPDWWVKSLIEREKISGVAPPAIGLRREDAELDALLDRQGSEEAVRRVVADFNRRVVEARRQLQGGPPVVTPTRDPDAEVVAWRERRTARRMRLREQAAGDARAAEPRRRRRFWPFG